MYYRTDNVVDGRLLLLIAVINLNYFIGIDHQEAQVGRGDPAQFLKNLKEAQFHAGDFEWVGR